MISCHNVADYFLAMQDDSEDDQITNLKLQKLVYYAQGYFLAIFDRPLFNESIEAWQHGPVVPELYHRFKEYGANPIPSITDFDSSTFDPDVVSLLNEVYSVFNQFSGSALRNMTHEEDPWKNHESNASIIPVDELMAFFKTRLN